MTFIEENIKFAFQKKTYYLDYFIETYTKAYTKIIKYYFFFELYSKKLIMKCN